MPKINKTPKPPKMYSLSDDVARKIITKNYKPKSKKRKKALADLEADFVTGHYNGLDLRTLVHFNHLQLAPIIEEIYRISHEQKIKIKGLNFSGMFDGPPSKYSFEGYLALNANSNPIFNFEPITHLNLSVNNFGHLISSTHLRSWLKTMPNLVSLHVSTNDFEDNSNDPENKMRLFFNNFSDVQLSQLTNLDLSNNNFSESNFSFLEKMTGLTHLDLSNCRIVETTVINLGDALVKLPNLEVLSLNEIGLGIDHDGIDNITHHDRGQYLTQIIKSVPHLKELELSSYNLTNSDIQTFLNNVKALRNPKNPHEDTSGIKLTTLNLFFNQLISDVDNELPDDIGFNIINKTRKVELMQFHEHLFTSFPLIQNLDFAAHIDNKKIVEMYFDFSNARYLHELNLVNMRLNNVSDQTVRRFIEAIKNTEIYKVHHIDFIKGTDDEKTELKLTLKENRERARFWYFSTGSTLKAKCRDISEGTDFLKKIFEYLTTYPENLNALEAGAQRKANKMLTQYELTYKKEKMLARAPVNPEIETISTPVKHKSCCAIQ